MEAAFGDSQEMVAFITELNANYYSLMVQFGRTVLTSITGIIKVFFLTNRQKMLLGQDWRK